MASIKELIKETLAQMEEIKGEATRKSMEDIMQRIFEKGMSPREALGLSEEVVEGVYGQAYRLYNSGNYEDASSLFRLLILLNANDARYSMGLAACLHMMKDYEAAINTYAYSQFMEPEDPMPYYYASDCYLKRNMISDAIACLESVVQLSGNQEKYALIKDRALLTIEGLKKKSS